MKLHTFERVYAWLLLVIFAGIVIHAPLTVIFGQIFPNDVLLIKSWKEIVMAVATVLALGLITRRHLWHELLHDWVIRLIVAYGGLHLILLTFMGRGAQAEVAGLAIDLRYVVFFGLVYVLLRLQPDYRRWIIRASLVGAVVVIGFGVLQLFLPADFLSHIGYSKQTIAPYLTVDKNPDYIRINSTLRGPNPLGAYAVIVLALITSFLAHWRSFKRDRNQRYLAIALGIGAAIVLWVSYSRSALVAGIVAVALVLVLFYFQRIKPRTWIISLVIIGALAGGLLVVRGSSFVSNVILHENPQGGSSVSSNDDHLKSLETGTTKALHQPLGGGIGSTGSASLLSNDGLIIENQYLFIAHETGWLGLLVFSALYTLILLRLWRARSDWLGCGLFASGVALGLIGFLLPVWADDTVSIIWWGLAAVALSSALATKEGKS